MFCHDCSQFMAALFGKIKSYGYLLWPVLHSSITQAPWKMHTYNVCIVVVVGEMTVVTIGHIVFAPQHNRLSRLQIHPLNLILFAITFLCDWESIRCAAPCQIPLKLLFWLDWHNWWHSLDICYVFQNNCEQLEHSSDHAVREKPLKCGQSFREEMTVVMKLQLFKSTLTLQESHFSRPYKLKGKV